VPDELSRPGVVKEIEFDFVDEILTQSRMQRYAKSRLQKHPVESQCSECRAVFFQGVLLPRFT